MAWDCAPRHAPAAYLSSFTSCRESLSKLGYSRLAPSEGFNHAAQLLKNTIPSSSVVDPLNLAYQQRTLSTKIDAELRERLLRSAASDLERGRLMACAAPKSGAFLRAIPSCEELTFSPTQMVGLLRLRMGVPLSPVL